MDAHDKQILDLIQSSFPITSRPYAEVGHKIGLTETEVLAKVQAMRQTGIIRRVGANFSSHRLGWRSTPCAAKVPEDYLEAFVAEVNRHSGVTHNYLRRHEFNVWFTYIGSDWDNVESTLAEITSKTGIQILNLVASKIFKIKVDFAMDDV